MPPKPEFFHELKSTVLLLTQKLDHVEREGKERDEKIEKLREANDVLRHESGILKQGQVEALKRIEELDRRFWNLLASFLGILLTFVLGLFVAYWKK